MIHFFCELSEIFHRPPIGNRPSKLPRYAGVTTLLGNPKGPVEVGNLNICAEVKLCLFLFMLRLTRRFNF